MHVRVEGTDPVTFQPVVSEFFEYAHRDHLGSIEVVTDENGDVLDHMAYEPFGLRRSKDWDSNATVAETSALLSRSLSRTPKVRGFTGHEHLDRTGFIHMNGRLYDPLLSRFLSPDPIVQSPTNSQSWNRYSYVFNRPTSATDPSGYVSIDDGFEIDVSSPGFGWGTVDYYDPVQATNGGPLYVPEDYDFGEGAWNNEDLDAELDNESISFEITVIAKRPSLWQRVYTLSELNVRILMEDLLELCEPACDFRAIDPATAEMMAEMTGNVGAVGIGNVTVATMGGASTIARSSRVPNRTVIGKVDDIQPENLRPGESSLLNRLPDQGNPQANWKQNSGVLRQEVRTGQPIRDASVDSAGNLRDNTGFLRAERNLLENQGFTYDPKTQLWNPPKP